MSAVGINTLGNDVGSISLSNNEYMHEAADPRQQRICLREIKQKMLAVQRLIKSLEDAIATDAATETFQFHILPLEEAEKKLTEVVGESHKHLGDAESNQALKEENSLLAQAHNCKLRARQLALRTSMADDVTAEDSISQVGR